MDDDGTAILAKLSDIGRTVADPAQDVRGRRVMDPAGEDLGTVEDLLVDPVEGKVRFLRVTHGGVLGFGATPSFIPVEAVTEVDEETVSISTSRQQVADAPAYDPELIDQQEYYERLYGYYGSVPSWTAGYTHTGHPFFR